MRAIPRGLLLLTVALVLGTGIVPAEDPSTEPPAAEEQTAPAAEPASAAPAVKTTRLQGSALLGRRQPVVGAAVAVRAAGQLSRFFVTCTDNKGRFRIDHVPDGLYEVILLKEGYARIAKPDVEVRFPFRPTVEVLMSPQTDADLRAEPPREFPEDRVAIDGVVRDGAGHAVPDVLLRLVRRDGSLDPRTVRSGSDGRFRMEDVPTGWWDAEVQAVGFLPVRAPLPLERPLDLVTQLVPHPSQYDSSPIDLLPREIPIPPADLAARRAD